MTKDSECHHPQLRAGLDPKHHWAQLVLPPCYIALLQYPWLCHFLLFSEPHLLALLALLFRNYSWHAQVTIWDTWNQIWVGRVQGKLPSVLSITPAPSLFSWCYLGRDQATHLRSLPIRLRDQWQNVKMAVCSFVPRAYSKALISS